MNIKEVKTAFKVADAKLDTAHPKNRIKFLFLPEIVDETGKKINKNILTNDAGRVYIIVVDGVIKKIGGSQCKGGIKATLSFYQGAMQGRPSIRTYGIHLLIKEALNKGCKVEIYIIVSKSIKGPVKGLFSESTATINPFREMEAMCKKDYISREGNFPEWNFQERGIPWPIRIRRKHAKYIETTV